MRIAVSPCLMIRSGDMATQDQDINECGKHALRVFLAPGVALLLGITFMQKCLITFPLTDGALRSEFLPGSPIGSV